MEFCNFIDTSQKFLLEGTASSHNCYNGRLSLVSVDDVNDYCNALVSCHYHEAN